MVILSITWFVIAPFEVPKAQSCDFIQGPAQPPLGQHAVDAIRRFTNVFKNENGVAEAWDMRGTQEVRRHCEIGHD
jgi:hypothetical protein